MKNILTLNEISEKAYPVFGSDYHVSDDAKSPVGIILRSFQMQNYTLAPETVAIARAGAGTNNIPCDAYAALGVVVFNTPGANANAVNELVMASVLLGSRKISNAIDWVKTLKGKGEDVQKLVEKGKSEFVGPEIAGKKLGIIGMGAIGTKVANSAVGMGMEVFGYDPYLSVENALVLSRSVKRLTNLDELIGECDYLTFHIPLLDSNRGMINRNFISKMKPGAVVINCARGELADIPDVLYAVHCGKLSRYITDFPCDELIGEENVICFPHIGASTPEAEDNCAVMAARELIDYIENGNIVNSVNYPACFSPKTSACRVTVNHLNQQNMIASVTSCFAGEHINIENLVNKSKGEYAYTIIDINGIGDETAGKILAGIENIPGVKRVRLLK